MLAKYYNIMSHLTLTRASYLAIIFTIRCHTNRFDWIWPKEETYKIIDFIIIHFSHFIDGTVPERSGGTLLRPFRNHFLALLCRRPVAVAVVVVVLKYLSYFGPPPWPSESAAAKQASVRLRHSYLPNFGSVNEFPDHCELWWYNNNKHNIIDLSSTFTSYWPRLRSIHCPADGRTCTSIHKY